MPPRKPKKKPTTAKPSRQVSKPVSKTDFYHALYLFALLVECGLDFDSASKVKSAYGNKLFSVIRLMVNDWADVDVKLSKSEGTSMEELRRLLLVCTNTGASPCELFKSISRAQVAKGLARKSGSRTALRTVSFGMKCGLSFEQSVQNFFELHLQGTHEGANDFNAFVEFLGEPALAEAMDALPPLMNSGGNAADYLDFLAGKTEL